MPLPIRPSTSEGRCSTCFMSAPMSCLAGIELVEFAVDHAAREELGAMLGTLGFHRAGRHRLKDAALWRPGGANLVLNAEPDSAASERFEQFGPCVCAMALRVDDTARVVEWPHSAASPRTCPVERPHGIASADRRVFEHLAQRADRGGVAARAEGSRASAGSGLPPAGTASRPAPIPPGCAPWRECSRWRRRS
ncbi:MAG TPA: hypothetical protein VGN83_00280 [Falsiroseomonas sp.]|nr:hypothetical protein [Falsiroseomonas sp.]